ncbi:TetR/AcrR family transcriptional regulator [Nocardioides caldifontis]|uniref:TetR/AcrR family transcriptional regulator n=1 Tax=Nocardioides caldifontis TaxID=2588938 RepID=UPI001939456D|nr:TetR/AcrR family transcriptional regulator [Nocardioides caldifontis]
METARALRLTQEERRSRMRRRLLEAAVACLQEKGYAATTVTEVQERAGVARGTLLHHFPAKAELMVAATEHLALERIERFRTEAADIPAGADRLAAVVDLAWADLAGPSFFTALELWVAARTDAELRATLLPVQERLFRALHDGLFEVLGSAGDDPRAHTLVELTIDALTGIAMSTMLTDRGGQVELLLSRWRRALEVLLGTRPSDGWL